jgi:GAF domain-containing protein
MLTRIRRFLVPPVFQDEERTRAASLLNTLLWSFFAAMAVYSVLSVAFPLTGLALALSGSAFAIGVVSLFLMRKGYVQGAGVLFTSALWVFLTVASTVSGGVNVPALFGYVAVTVFAGMLLGGNAGFFSAGVSSVAALAMALAESQGFLVPSRAPYSPFSNWAALSLYVALAAVVLRIATRSLGRALETARRNERDLAESNRELQAIRASLEERVAERTRILQVAADISHAAMDSHGVEDLLPQLAGLIRRELGFDYAALYLLEENGPYAILQAAAGEAPVEDRLAAGGDSTVSQCIARNEPYVSAVVDQSVALADNSGAPEMRAEMALPLRSGGQLMGALVVHSAGESVLRDVDLVAMQTATDQVAAVIHNTQLLAETQAALDRSDQAVRRYVQESWDRFVGLERSVVGYRHSATESGPAEDAWLPPMEDAVREKRSVLADGVHGDAVLAMPFLSHDEVIGVMGVQRSSGEPWSEEEVSLVRVVSEQLAQALETMRLFEETRQRAQREQVLRRTSDIVRAQPDLDSVLRAAVQEMRRAVGATHVAIRLGTETGPGPSGSER